MNKRRLFSFFFVVAALLIPLKTLSAQTTWTSSTTVTNNDTWNVAVNWSAGVPTGAVNVIIPNGKIVTAWKADTTPTPTYTGNLSIGANSTLRIGFTTTAGFQTSYNALGTPGSTVITMAEGALIAIRLSGSPIIPQIVLTGNAGIRLGESTQTPANADFNYSITGPHGFTITSNQQTPTIDLNAANSFSSLTINTISGRGLNAGVFNANATNSLGSGNVTVTPNGTASHRLVFNDTVNKNAMSDTGILFYNGLGVTGAGGANLVTMNANETIGGLVINGVLQAAGNYLGSASASDFVGGNSTLTVAGVPLYWDTNGGAAGTNASSTGNWNDASWSLSADGTSATLHPWTSGYDAVFSAGTNGTGTQTITVTGTQNVKSLTVEEGTVAFVDGGSGVLNLNSGAGTATVALGAVLSGNLSIGGNVAGAGTISPGLSPGEITITGMFDMSGTYLWELGALVDDSTPGTPGSDWDLVSAGSADLADLTLDLDFIFSATDPDVGDPFWDSDHTWLIVDASSPIMGNFAAVTYQGGPIAFEAGSFSTFVTGNQAFLQFTTAMAVPEPASIALWTLLGVGMIGLGIRLRRDNQQFRGQR